MSKIDTPTLSNAIELQKIRNNTEGFCSRDIKCLFPDLGVKCGFAVTARVRTMQKEKSSSHDGLIELCKALQFSPKPAVVVFEEMTPQKEFSAHCGEVMATIFAKLNVSAVVSDSAVRDLEEVHGLGIGYFAPGSVASHANFRIIDVQVPVTVGGMEISPGDFLHGDLNGLLKVPIERMEELPKLVALVRQREREIIDTIKNNEFSIDYLKEKFTH